MSENEVSNERRVAVIIVNWNAWRESIECIDSLLAQRHRNFHTYIVDNDSQDRSIEHIASWCVEPKRDPIWRNHPGVDRLTDQRGRESVGYRVIDRTEIAPAPPPSCCELTMVRSGGNLGFAGGCNVGIRAAGVRNFDYFWFLNADAVVDRHALTELIDRATIGSDIGMVGSTVRYYDAPDRIQAMGGALLNRFNGNSRHIGEGAHLRDVPTDGSTIEREMTYVMGASMLVSQRYIDEVGFMEEDYFLYFEDADWAMRGAGRFSLGFAPRSHIFHKWGVNSHKAAALFSSGFYYRNRLRFVARFLPERLGAAKRALFEQMLRHIAKGRWAQARLVGTTLLRAKKITADVKPVF
jgi:GT2 family glycosyltransferase